jgi:PleD family two-component response regulator
LDSQANLPHRILVAAHDRPAADALVRLLIGRGHVVRAACGMADVLAVFAEFKPQLVILKLDSTAPEGIETARALRHVRHGDQRITLVALADHTDSNALAQAHAAGFDIVVPVLVEDPFICDLVQGAVDTHSADARAGDALDRVLRGAAAVP